MVVIRNVFQLKFGKAKEAVALMKESVAIQKKALADVQFSTRVLTDVTGPFYTLVLELTVPNLSTFESYAPRLFGDKEWQASYQRWWHWWSQAIATCTQWWSDFHAPFRRVIDGAHSAKLKLCATTALRTPASSTTTAPGHRCHRPCILARGSRSNLPKLKNPQRESRCGFRSRPRQAVRCRGCRFD
jgi:hypothetical protein